MINREVVEERAHGPLLSQYLYESTEENH